MKFSSHLLVFATLFVLCLTDTVNHDRELAGSKSGVKENTFTLFDISKDFIRKAKYIYPNCSEDDLNCLQMEKSLAILDVAMNVISEVKKSYPTSPDSECPKPMDCSDILRSGKTESGVYTIWPRNRILNKKSLNVYCDMDTDGGGWTVIQRRGNFSTPSDYFYKDWESYKKGFGNITEEFWIGNENIFAISNQANYSIRFDLEDAHGNARYAQYNTFWIGNEVDFYTLRIHGYSGNAGDAMRHHENMKFSTRDRDNDPYFYSCAVEYQGAWWYNSCLKANLNGLFEPGVNTSQRIVWNTWKKYMALARVEMKLRS